jgi:hypothetical protein
MRVPSRRTGIESHERPFPQKPKTIARTVAHLRAEDECAALLAEAMRKSPRSRTKTKNQFWGDFQHHFGLKLTRRAFERAWSTAVRETGAHAWTYPGAPRRET